MYIIFVHIHHFVKIENLHIHNRKNKFKRENKFHTHGYQSYHKNIMASFSPFGLAFRY
jgi:hypothetical protein